MDEIAGQVEKSERDWFDESQKTTHRDGLVYKRCDFLCQDFFCVACKAGCWVGSRGLLFCAGVVFLRGVSSGVLGLVDLTVEVVDLVALEFELAAPTHQKDKEEEEGKVTNPEGQSNA